MLTIYEVCDPDAAGYRQLFASLEQAKRYWIGGINQSDITFNIQCHHFSNAEALVAFLESNYTSWMPDDLYKVE